MDDRIMQAAMRAYEYATDDDAVSRRGLRAAVSRALEIQREEIAAAIEAQVAWQREKYGDGADKVATGRLVGMEDALRTVREHGKES